jgi:four helix bundle protein
MASFYVDDQGEMDRVFGEPASSYGGNQRKTSVEFATELKARTKAVAKQLINFMEGAGKGPALNVIRYQLLKSGTSVGANYRAACRARSKREWYAKMCIVVEECDETVFWIELLIESDVRVDQVDLGAIGKEYQSLLQIFAKARANTKL